MTGGGRLDVEVHAYGLSPPLQVHEEGASTGDGGHEWLGDCHGERRRDGGIHGIPALLQYRRTHLGANGMGGDDHPAGGDGCGFRDDG